MTVPRGQNDDFLPVGFEVGIGIAVLPRLAETIEDTPPVSDVSAVVPSPRISVVIFDPPRFRRFWSYTPYFRRFCRTRDGR